MKTLATPILVASSFAIAGCATATLTQPATPPSAELRNRISRVAVVTFANSPRVLLQVPDSKADIANEPSMLSNLERAAENTRVIGRAARSQAPSSAASDPSHLTGGRLDLSDEPGPYVPVPDLIGLAIDAPLLSVVPPLAEVRRTYGLIVADSEKNVTTARTTLDQAVANLHFETELRARVLAALQRKSPSVAATPTETFARPPAPQPTRSSRLNSRPADVPPSFTAEEPGYRVSARDADTILEIKVLEPRLDEAASISSAQSALTDANVHSPLLNVFARWLDSRDRINPGLSLGVHVRVRLLSAFDRSELYYDYLEYRGAKQTFVHWAADDARAFHAEVDRCLQHLADEIVAQVFVRGEAEHADTQQLAAAGIHRRPSAPSSPAYSPVWAPSRPLRAYAANR